MFYVQQRKVVRDDEGRPVYERTMTILPGFTSRKDAEAKARALFPDGDWKVVEQDQ